MANIWNLTLTFPVFIGRVIATFTCSGEKEVNLAVQDAKTAFKIWSKKSGMERCRILLEAARIIRVCFNLISSRKVLLHCSVILCVCDDLQLNWCIIKWYLLTMRSKNISICSPWYVQQASLQWFLSGSWLLVTSPWAGSLFLLCCNDNVAFVACLVSFSF